MKGKRALWTPGLAWARRSAGVSLIELMVALVIGSLLIAGAVAVYMQSRNTYRVTEAAARLQEVGRYALDTLEPDLRLAGFWGLTFGADAIDNRFGPADAQSPIDDDVTNVNNCGNNWSVNAAQFIDGRDSVDTGGSGYDLACAGINPPSWADVLIVRRASTGVRDLDAGRIQIQTNRLHGVLFDDGVIPVGFGPVPASETHDLIIHAYYISESPPLANGERQFALRRQTLTGGANPDITDIEIIPGIEDLQVQFGIDADGDADGSTDRYVDPESAPVGARITSIRLWLRVISEDREVGFTNNRDFIYANANYSGALNDGRRRVLITKTIQIRNSRV